jgi:hypothetical protein
MKNRNLIKMNQVEIETTLVLKKDVDIETLIAFKTKEIQELTKKIEKEIKKTS